MGDTYLSYVGVRVTDLNRSVEFYRGLFDLKEVSRGDGSGTGMGAMVLLRDELTGQKLELNYYPPGSPYAVPYVPGEGLDHVSFRVANLAEKLRELAERGIRPLRPTDPAEPAPGLKVSYVPDPDGNWIELWESGGPMPTTAPETY